MSKKNQDPINPELLTQYLNGIPEVAKRRRIVARLINKFIGSNPQVKEEEFVIRMDGTIEWICEHGVGHPITGGIHGCDGCCSRVKLAEEKK